MKRITPGDYRNAADIEGLAISSALPGAKTGVASIVHGLRLRSVGAVLLRSFLRAAICR